MCCRKCSRVVALAEQLDADQSFVAGTPAGRLVRLSHMRAFSGAVLTDGGVIHCGCGAVLGSTDARGAPVLSLYALQRPEEGAVVMGAAPPQAPHRRAGERGVLELLRGVAAQLEAAAGGSDAGVQR